MENIVCKNRMIGNKIFNIYGDTQDKSVFRNILANADYENHMIEFYCELLKEDSICIDAGANIGILSMYMSLTTTQSIYAFEPAIETFNVLKKNIEENKMNVIAINKALGNYTGKINFMFNRESNGGSALMPVDTVLTNPVEVKREVDVITLDDFVKENNIKKLDLLKMDVEGYETLILEGGENTIKELRPDIVTEYCFPYIRARGLSPEKFWDLLQDNYKSIYLVDRPIMQLIKVKTAQELEKLLEKYDTIGDVFATNKEF